MKLKPFLWSGPIKGYGIGDMWQTPVLGGHVGYRVCDNIAGRKRFKVFFGRHKVGSASTLQKAQDVAFADFTDRVSEHIR